MTVRELIERLTTFPPELPVLLDGYEGGLTPAREVEAIRYVPDFHESGWMGPHERAERVPEVNSLPAVYLPRL